MTTATAPADVVTVADVTAALTAAGITTRRVDVARSYAHPGAVVVAVLRTRGETSPAHRAAVADVRTALAPFTLRRCCGTASLLVSAAA